MVRHTLLNKRKVEVCLTDKPLQIQDSLYRYNL